MDRHYDSLIPAWRSGRPASITRLIVSIFWFLLLVLLLAPSIALAQSPEQEAALAEAKRLNEEATALYRAGEFSRAEAVIKRSLAIREKELGPEHPKVASSLNNLAALYRLLKRENHAADWRPVRRRSRPSTPERTRQSELDVMNIAE